MSTSVDDGLNAMLPQFQRNMAAKLAAQNQSGGAATARITRPSPPSYSTSSSSSSSSGFTSARSSTGRDVARTARLAASAAHTAISHGIPPNFEVPKGSAPLGDLAQPRTWELMNLRELNDVRPPRRYFSQRIRRVVYGGNYWSAPMRTAAQRARGMTEDSVTVKAFDRKLLPVSELIKRIEEQQQALAKRREEIRMAPIRAKNKMLRLQRRGTGPRDEGDSSESDEEASLEHENIDLMSLLDATTLHRIKAEFARHEKALSLQEFVDVMRRYIQPTEQLTEVKLVANLCAFFNAVDVNCDRLMEWNEFTNFLTDAGLASSNASTTSAVSGSEVSYDNVEEYRKSTIVDDYPWSQPIERIYYFDAIDHLLTFESHRHSFNVFRGKKLSHVATVEGHTSELLSAEYIDKFHWVCTSANDRSIRFFDATDYRPVKNLVIHSDHTNMVLRWAPSQNLLFTATDQKQIRAWRIEKSNTMQTVNQGNNAAAAAAAGINLNGIGSSFIGANQSNKLNHYSTEVVSTFSGQNEISLDLLVLDNMSSLASASLDTTIALFDLNTHVRTSVLKNGHKKGVFQLGYHETYHVLVSAAFEHAAILWNPYVAQKICKLKGHYNPLIGVQCVPNSPQILTADSGGIVKIWDIRNFSCCQTLYVEDDKESRVDSLTSFVALAPHRRIVSSSHKLFVYDSLTSSSFQAPNIADLDPTIKCLYNNATGNFISASGSTIKIWNGSTGILERVYRNVLPGSGGEITALTLDDAQKKFITGDTNGTICVFKFLNGSLMKSVTIPGAREITALEYIPQLKNILAAAWDGSISLYDENQEEGIQLIKKLKGASSTANTLNPAASTPLATVSSFSSGEIITSAYSTALTLFATGSSSGLIQLWDFRSHSFVGELPGHTSEITSMVFLDPFPLLVSADNESNICFWAVRPMVINVGKCVLRLLNTIKGKPKVESSKENNESKEATNANTSASSTGTATTSTKDKRGKKGQASSSTAPANNAKDDLCPVTSLAFWSNIDARTYVAAYCKDAGAPSLDSLMPEYYAKLYAGDVNGVIRCWDVLGAIQRWKLLPFYSHDRLIPTGKDLIEESNLTKVPSPIAASARSYIGGSGSVQEEPNPYGLTESEKRRLQKQIQENGLAAGGSATSTRLDGEELNSPDGASAALDVNSGPKSFLPQLVTDMINQNLSGYVKTSAAMNKAIEIGNSMGTNSIEYEAAIALIPGATAKHWLLQKNQKKELAEIEARVKQLEEEAKAAKQAEKAAQIQKRGSVISRKTSISRSAHDKSAEEKQNDGTEEAQEPKASVTHSSKESDALAQHGTRVLSQKLSALANAAARGPLISNNFSRGSVKLRASSTNNSTLTSPTNASATAVQANAASAPGDASTEKNEDATLKRVNSQSTLQLPAIPLLPLNSLTNSGGPAFALSNALGNLNVAANGAAAAAANNLSSLSFLPKAALRPARANDYVEYRHLHRDCMRELETAARLRTTLLQPGDIKLERWWRAHTDSIRDLSIVREERRYKDGIAVPQDSLSEALLSTSFDKKVCLWNLKGVTIGHLQQGRTENVLASYQTGTNANPSDPTAAASTTTGAARGRLHHESSLKPDWVFLSDVRGRYQKSQFTARQVLNRIRVSEKNQPMTARTATADSKSAKAETETKKPMSKRARRARQPSNLVDDDDAALDALLDSDSENESAMEDLSDVEEDASGLVNLSTAPYMNQRGTTFLTQSAH